MDEAARRSEVDPEQQARRVMELLDEAYGRPVWHQRLLALEELVLTILSQHTSDVNSGKAFDTLRERFPTWEQVLEAPAADVIDAVRSCGLANQKGPRIQAALAEIEAREGRLSLDRMAQLPTDEVLAYLTSMHGVGPKTAACVLMFSLGRPYMPVDTHVHRISKRLGLIGPTTSADDAHVVLNELLPAEDLYPFHINLIRHGRQVCHAQRPECPQCPLLQVCPHGQGLLGMREPEGR
ncbi:MAG TPA: endonuclease III [Armatimonadota bacterium]